MSPIKRHAVFFRAHILMMVMCVGLFIKEANASAPYTITLSGAVVENDSGNLNPTYPLVWTAPTTGSINLTTNNFTMETSSQEPYGFYLWVNTANGVSILPKANYWIPGASNIFKVVAGTQYYIYTECLNCYTTNLNVMITANVPASPAPSQTPDLIVRLKGPAGLANMLPVIANAMFAPGTITRISDGANGKIFQGYYGFVYGNVDFTKGAGVLNGESINGIPVGSSTWGGSSDVLLNKFVMLEADLDDNAAETYNAMTNNVAIPYMAVNGSCAAIAGSAYPNPTYNCTGVSNATVDIGLSDVEDAILTGSNLPKGIMVNTMNDSSSLSMQWVHDAVLGLAVTNNVSINNLSNSQVAAILTGNYTDWNSVSSTSYPAPGVNPITVESYTNGSGVSAFTEAYVLNYPCDAAYNGGISTAPAQGDPVNFSTYTVVQNENSYGVVSGLNSVYAKGKRGFAILSTEIQPQSTDNWHFISMNGAAPTVANAASGVSDFFVERSILTQYYPTRTDTYATSVPSLATAITNLLSTPAALATIPGVGQSGVNVSNQGLTDTGYISDMFLSTRFQTSCLPAQLYPLSAY